MLFINTFRCAKPICSRMSRIPIAFANWLCYAITWICQCTRTTKKANEFVQKEFQNKQAVLTQTSPSFKAAVLSPNQGGSTPAVGPSAPSAATALTPTAAAHFAIASATPPLVTPVPVRPLIDMVAAPSEVSKFDSLRPSMLFRGITDAEWKALTDSLERIPQENVEILCKTLAEEDQKTLEELYLQPQFPYTVLMALHQRSLNSLQAATLVQLYTSKEFYKKVNLERWAKDQKAIALKTTDCSPELHFLYTRGIKNEATAKMLEEAFTTVHPGTRSEALLTSAQFQTFLKKISEFPLVDQQIFIVPYIFEARAGLGIISAVVRRHVPLLFRDDTAGQFSHLVPSMRMVQVLLEVKFGENALNVLPTFGPTTPDDIGYDYRRDNGRVVAIRSPFTVLSPKADQIMAPAESTTIHDLFHLVIAGFIPRTHREIHVSIWDALGKVCRWRFNFVDMQFYDYLILSPEDAFWKTVTTTLRELLELKQTLPKEEIFRRAYQCIFTHPVAKELGLTKASFERYFTRFQRSVKGIPIDQAEVARAIVVS